VKELGNPIDETLTTGRWPVTGLRRIPPMGRLFENTAAREEKIRRIRRTIGL